MLSASTITRASKLSSVPDSLQPIDQVLDRIPLALLERVSPFHNRGTLAASDGRGLVGAVVGHDQDLEQLRGILDRAAAPHGLRDALLLVVGGDHDEEACSRVRWEHRLST